MESDRTRTADTHLQLLPLPTQWGIDLYLKDESTHPTGSLKHRLARSLLLYGLVNGDVDEHTTLVEASSGSTAVSIAHFARLLGLPFVAVMPRSTSPAKIRLIEFYGGTCSFVETADAVYECAEKLGERPRYFYLDQFARASLVTDWRGNNNIAASIFEQMRAERHPEPRWIVVGAGTGGTSATIGRYSRYIGARTRLCVVDPEGSAFAEAWRTGSRDVVACGSRIEGIGRPRVEPSFVPAVIDEVLRVADADSIAAMRWLHDRMNLSAGPSTGTNLVGAFELIARMRDAGETGSVVTLLCDSGSRYEDSYYDDDWVASQDIDLPAARERIERLFAGEPMTRPETSTDITSHPLLSRLREDLRDLTVSVGRAVLMPDDADGLPPAWRWAIALRVAKVHEDSELTDRYTRALRSVDADLTERVLSSSRWRELPRPLGAILEHAEQVALDPIDSGEAEIALLRKRGCSPRDIVVATQVVAYVSYLTRLLTGLRCLAAPATAAATVPPARDMGEVPDPAERFPTYRWHPWVDAPAPPEKEAGADSRTPRKWSPFYLTLLHDPEVLGERTALYDAIMTGSGALGRADRELAALATSLTTGCEYCASVHGRRQVQLSKDRVSAPALATHGATGLADLRQRTLAFIASTIAVTPTAVTAAHIAALREVGLDDDAVADFLAVCAMFAWANRLMMTLGQPED
ncbi:pyridoxal-phosphate dependent enzyme [Aeromicrobium sp. YIM 150415]|uniref:pyridoxal-phosphate dependent enzyme n=1 Tax=Aeromicrobium sp. YIM 150415 TaxID=2803912 RepID=UPI0023DD18DD|nr:pyridoxal-phosphate dependent enzyme [Aeromicrobium sp. YIM 150415]